MKSQIMFWLMNKKYKTPNTCRIHCTSSIHKVSCAGYNTISNSALVSNVKLGFLSNINNNCEIINTEIGKFCSMGPRVCTIIGRHPTSKIVSINPVFYSLRMQNGFTYADNQLFEEFKYVDKKGNISVKIGNDVWIGADVKILEGVTIGDGAIIATGAVVTKDVSPYSIVGGVPAKVISYRFTENQISRLQEIKWWNWSLEKIEKKSAFFSDIDIFLKDVEDDNGI